MDLDSRIEADHKEQKLREEWEVKCYGMTAEEIMQDLPSYTKNSDAQLLMYAMGIMSDAQHIMLSHEEDARQFINKAKYLVDKVQSKLHKKEMGR
jgi:hypothetical protein